MINEAIKRQNLILFASSFEELGYILEAAKPSSDEWLYEEMVRNGDEIVVNTKKGKAKAFLNLIGNYAEIRSANGKIITVIVE